MDRSVDATRESGAGLELELELGRVLDVPRLGGEESVVVLGMVSLGVRREWKREIGGSCADVGIVGESGCYGTYCCGGLQH